MLPQHPLPPSITTTVVTGITRAATPTTARTVQAVSTTPAAPASAAMPDHMTLVRLQHEAAAAKDMQSYFYLHFLMNGHPDHVAAQLASVRARELSQDPAYDAYYQHRPAAAATPPAAHAAAAAAIPQPPQLAQSPVVAQALEVVRQAPPAALEFTLPNLETYPVVWQGYLGLKAEMATVQFHYVEGCKDLARASLPVTRGEMPTLRIGQRMRLEESQLEGVYRKMEREDEHCVLLALPCGKDAADVEHQSRRLRSHFVTYLQLKSAAGIVNVPGADDRSSFVVHVFPSCDFANVTMGKIAPDLLSRVAEIEHMVIVIATQS